MEEEKIRGLEPKYTGNTRHLTEGEAGEILNDPANQEGDRDLNLSDLALASLALTQRGNNGTPN